METTFWEFSQNNSGGNFDVDEKLCHRLFIESENYNKARAKAMGMGVYFNGCDDGRDCNCCGDRWSDNEDLFKQRYGSFDKTEADEIAKKYESSIKKTTFRFMHTGEPDPNKYDVIFKDVEAYAQYLADEYGQTKPDSRIFYLSGEVKEVFKKN